MTDSPLFSEHWHRVKDLSPRLAIDVEIKRHIYRKQVQYILHRRSTGTYFRLDDQTFEIIGKLDGSVRIDELWELTLQSLNEQAPTQSEIIQILAQLHEAELLIVNRRLNAEQLFKRQNTKNAAERKQRYLNPLFLRFRLFDPDSLLNKITPTVNWVFTRTTFIIWLFSGDSCCCRVTAQHTHTESRNHDF